MTITVGKRSARAARISAVEILDSRIKDLEAEDSDCRVARDHAFWEAQREGVEIRVLAIFCGLSVQAIYQGIERAKERETERLRHGG